MNKINVKSEVLYRVIINKEIEVNDVSNQEEIKDNLAYDAWRMIKDGDFNSVDVKYTRII